MEHFKRITKVALSLILVFATLWLIFAIWDIGGKKNVVKVYNAIPTIDRTSSIYPNVTLPEFLPTSVTEYRVSDNTVTSKIGNFVHKYDQCEIFNESNWKCTYNDNSATFGFKSGQYFSHSNIEKFPHLSELNEKYLSRFEYVVLDCRWQLADSPLQTFACLFLPFFI